MGLTFKQDAPTIRASKVPDILAELREYRIAALVNYPLGDQAATFHDYGVTLSPPEPLTELEALMLTVNHGVYLTDPADLVVRVRGGSLLVDVKSGLDHSNLPKHLP